MLIIYTNNINIFMRILWFTNTPSNYKAVGGYNGGGWISSLEEEIAKRTDLQLGISFFKNNEPHKIIKGNTIYFPLKMEKCLFGGRWKKRILEPEKIDCANVTKYIEIIDEFQPDVIEVFGTEDSFGLLTKIINIPVVIHIQGLLMAYENAYFPPSISKHNYLWSDINLLSILKKKIHLLNFHNNANREIRIIKCNKYFIGRTVWDERIVKLFNQNAIYFYGGEILREVFYEDQSRTLPNKAIIITTISSPLYKGFDVVLKTAKLLKGEYNLDFTWIVYGDISPNFIENKVGIFSREVNVELRGVVTAAELKKSLLGATCFVHPSYIDNSPNSICEAQILGVPVISTNVGGISTLLKDGEAGWLVPSNDPFQMAYLINMLSKNINLNIKKGLVGKNIAKQRHNKTIIVDELIKTYNILIENEKL